METPAAIAVIASAHREGKAVRIQRRDGEELVVRVLHHDVQTLVYAVYTSTHPERYAVCDSTGFTVPLAEIERVQMLRNPDGPAPRKRRRGPASRAPDIREKPPGGATRDPR